MPAGLQIVNDDNVIVIDENYFNMVLRDKVVGTTVSETGTNFGRASYSISTATFPLIAWQADDLLTLAHWEKNGSTFNFEFWSAATPGSDYTLFVFAEPDPNATYENFGLEVRNVAGAMTYHSDCKPARVVGPIDTATYDPGRQYATARTRLEIKRSAVPLQPPDQNPTWYWQNTHLGGCRGYQGGASDGLWLASVQLVQPVFGRQQFGNQSDAMTLVLDVTGY